MNSRSPFQTSPPSKAMSKLAPPTNTSPKTMKPSPTARVVATFSRRNNQANKVVHKGRLPGMSTEACVAGAYTKPV